ncbi:TetR/AcrR family transcriptional regulator [Nakamurella sp.]|uniref:TetR/AcrR family transcriptional regulator n=1 Tax=Nakamurella sp. TaxID=1869182 RepID=UPI0037845683
MPRPSQPILSRDLICRTALKLLDRTGRFTVPELAQKLGVSVSSLYHHVAGRAEIVEGIRGLLAGRFAPLDDDTPWAAGVAAWARSYRDAFAAHPAAIPALVAQTITDRVTLHQYGALAGLLSRAGFGPDEVVLAITMLDTLCLGAALDVGAPSVIWEESPGLDSPLQTALGRATLGPDRAEKGFELGLSLTIRGLAEMLEAQRAH